MENKASYFYIGIFVFGIFAVAVFFMVWLSGFSHKERFEYYQLFTQESISGLGIKAPVRLLGVEVGSVEDTSIDTTQGGVGVRILIKLKEGTPITHNTYATLALQGITGLKFIELRADSEEKAVLTHANKDEIPTIPVKQGFLSTLDKQGDKFIQLLDYTNEQLHLIFSEKNVRNFGRILENFANFNKTLGPTLANFSSASQKMAHLADNYGDIKGSLGSNLEVLEALLIQMSETLRNLKQSPSDIFFKSGKNKPAPGE